MDVKLRVTQGKNVGQDVPIPGKKFLIGRAEDCHLRAGSDLISRHHCVIIIEDGYLAVRDFGSKNGTSVNGERVAGECELKHGDELRLGPLEFVVQVSQETLSGKKKPPVHDPKEAAARTAASPVEEEPDVAALAERTGVAAEGSLDARHAAGPHGRHRRNRCREHAGIRHAAGLKFLGRHSTKHAAPTGCNKARTGRAEGRGAYRDEAGGAYFDEAGSAGLEAGGDRSSRRCTKTGRGRTGPPFPAVDGSAAGVCGGTGTTARGTGGGDCSAPAAEKKGFFGGGKKFGKLPQQPQQGSKDSRSAASDMLDKLRKRR